MPERLVGIPNENIFWEQVKYLEQFHQEHNGGKAAVERIRTGLQLAWHEISDAKTLAQLFDDREGGWFSAIKERMNAMRPIKSVSAVEMLCIDGRLTRHSRFIPRLLGSFSTPAALLESKNDIWGSPDLIASEDMAASIEDTVASGRVILENVGPHHSFRHGTDHQHPEGCGAFRGWLQSNVFTSRRHPHDFPDGGVALDLVRGDRQETERLLTLKGAIVINRIIDTDTQGLVFIGDDLYGAINNALKEDEYIPLTLDAVYRSHAGEENNDEQPVIYTPALMEEMATFFTENGFAYQSIEWNSVDCLGGNTEQCVAVTEVIMDSSWADKIRERLYRLYGDRFETHRGATVTADLIQELAVQIAYNTSVLWLSGFDKEENVPDRFKHHGERYGVIGDKGFDYWVGDSPFILAASESPEAVHRNLNTMMSLLPPILQEVHGVNLDQEAVVLFVTGVVDRGGSVEAQRRSLAALRGRYQHKMEYLEEYHYLTEGRVLLIPLVVDEKTREPLYIPDLSKKFGLR